MVVDAGKNLNRDKTQEKMQKCVDCLSYFIPAQAIIREGVFRCVDCDQKIYRPVQPLWDRWSMN